MEQTVLNHGGAQTPGSDFELGVEGTGHVLNRGRATIRTTIDPTMRGGADISAIAFIADGFERQGLYDPVVVRRGALPGTVPPFLMIAPIGGDAAAILNDSFACLILIDQLPDLATQLAARQNLASIIQDEISLQV